jgi:hypothetical protein
MLKGMPLSAYYSPYDQVLSRFTAETVENATYSCGDVAVSFARASMLPAIRSIGCFNGLQGLHRVAKPYAIFVLRPLLFMALIWSCVGLFKGKITPTYSWMSFLILTHILSRGILTCVDERYQLPIDLIFILWIGLTFRRVFNWRLAFCAV